MKSFCIFLISITFLKAATSTCDRRTILPTIVLTDSTGQQYVNHQIEKYIVPKNVKTFILNCSYSQHIDWKFEGVMANSIVTITRGQTYEKFWDWSNPCFYIALEFRSIEDQITGSYNCFSLSNKAEARSVTIFSGHDEDKARFILQGKSSQLELKAGMRETTLEFPCAMNNPNKRVILSFKAENSKEWSKMKDGQILSFSPAIGYQILADTTAVGEYKCEIVGSTDQKPLFVTVKSAPEYLINPMERADSPESRLKIPANVNSSYSLTCSSRAPVSIHILNPNLLQVLHNIAETVDNNSEYLYTAKITVTYNGNTTPTRNTGKINCLKKGTNETIHTWTFTWTSPTSIGLGLDVERITATCYSALLDHVTMYYTPCETLTECQFKGKCLHDTNRCATNISLSLHKLTETSAVAVLPQQSGVVRCHSPDVESTRSFYTQADGEAIAEDILSSDEGRIIHGVVSPKSLKVGDFLTIECWIIQRTFGEGPILVFGWKNETYTEIPKAQILNSTIEKRLGSIYRKAKVQIPSTNINEVNCLGLLYYKSGSRRAGEDLGAIVVKDREVTIQGDAEENVEFVEDKAANLTCVGQSYPLPSFEWKTPPNAKLVTKIHEEDCGMWRCSTLIFTLIDSSIKGEYVCKASTSNQTAEKKFIVTFIEGSGTGTTIGIIIGVILLLSLIGFGVWFAWKKHTGETFFSRTPGSHQYERPLTQKDIDEFRNGNQDAIAGSKDPYVIIQNSPYDQKYDILKEDLELDKNKLLGMGAYGMVMKGKVKGDRFPKPTEVAVKTVKPNAEPEYIKSLLTELKVMIYVGKDKHIVDLVGACTQELSDKQLYIVLHLCPNGGLENYLRNHREVFVNQVVKGKLEPSRIEQMYVNTKEGTLYTADLIRWSLQIASGMEYLAEKKVIHGDLATRNVLLDESLVAKISDFGLARQMYEYTQYTKKQQAPLPWRWMAIESLRDMAFSTESDVWSFGITLWEIMTLAETPYPGLTWNPQFINTLLDGYRMAKPKFAPSEVYDIMLNCWREKPSDRTNFTDLKDQFQEILESKFQHGYINPGE